MCDCCVFSIHVDIIVVVIGYICYVAVATMVILSYSEFGNDIDILMYV